MLELEGDDLVIPEHFASMGAIGAVLKSGDDLGETDWSRLDELAGASQADEIMITSPIYGHAARKRSYELMADIYAIAPAESASV